MQAGMGGNPGDPFSFLHALIGMDQGQFQRMLAMLGGDQLMPKSRRVGVSETGRTP
jgi:hypothetical protein